MKPSARRRARELAVQAIYQWQFSPELGGAIKEQFFAKLNPKKIDREYFELLVDGVVASCAELDQLLAPLLDRKLADLNLVELAVLRLAVFELNDCQDVPYKVVINEALELAKIFGSVEGYKYVNGVLDRAARVLRAGAESNSTEVVES